MLKMINYKLLLSIFLAIALNGCSTIVVHSKPDVTPPPYAGTGVAITKTKKQWYNFDFYGAVTLTAFDVPFSFLADTVLYPVDLYRLNNSEINGKKVSTNNLR